MRGEFDVNQQIAVRFALREDGKAAAEVKLTNACEERAATHRVKYAAMSQIANPEPEKANARAELLGRRRQLRVKCARRQQYLKNACHFLKAPRLLRSSRWHTHMRKLRQHFAKKEAATSQIAKLEVENTDARTPFS